MQSFLVCQPLLAISKRLPFPLSDSPDYPVGLGQRQQDLLVSAALLLLVLVRSRR